MLGFGAVIQHFLDLIIVTDHDRKNGGEGSFKDEETFQECGCCLLASAFITCVTLEVMSVSRVKAKEASLFVLDVHLLSEVGSEALGLLDARMCELSTPLEDEECLSDLVLASLFIFLSLQGLQLNLAVESFELVLFKDVDKLYILGNLLPFFLNISNILFDPLLGQRLP